MFHRDVDKGDFIIRQGADGDNFYVIERWCFLVLRVSMDVLYCRDVITRPH